TAEAPLRRQIGRRSAIISAALQKSGRSGSGSQVDRVDLGHDLGGDERGHGGGQEDGGTDHDGHLGGEDAVLVVTDAGDEMSDDQAEELKLKHGETPFWLVRGQDKPWATRSRAG